MPGEERQKKPRSWGQASKKLWSRHKKRIDEGERKSLKKKIP